jgi:hypothetical protein
VEVQRLAAPLDYLIDVFPQRISIFDREVLIDTPRLGADHYVVCNADEGEPGTFKDRMLLTEFPDLVF